MKTKTICFVKFSSYTKASKIYSDMLHNRVWPVGTFYDQRDLAFEFPNGNELEFISKNTELHLNNPRTRFKILDETTFVNGYRKFLKFGMY